MSLLSNSQITAIQNVAARGLVDTAIICPKTTTPVTGGDDKFTWPPGVTVKCWVRQMNDPHLAEQLGLVVSEGIFRINLPVDTVVHIDDQIEISGVRYTVQNTNDENTYRVFQEAYARKLE